MSLGNLRKSSQGMVNNLQMVAEFKKKISVDGRQSDGSRRNPCRAAFGTGFFSATQGVV